MATRLVDVHAQISTDLTAAFLKLRMAKFRRAQRDDAHNRKAVAEAYSAIDAILDMANDVKKGER